MRRVDGPGRPVPGVRLILASDFRPTQRNPTCYNLDLTLMIQRPAGCQAGGGGRPAVETNDAKGRRARTIRHDDRIERRVLYGMPLMLFVLGALGLAIFSGRLTD